ncbi:MAG: hypothetical protein HKM24_01505 [Gammaproteobacteria bacterium]|nr:hypothetical protein [Gammaproteobacteria bacterium]
MSLITLLTQFFLWCTIINGALLIFWALMLMAVPNAIYRLQSRFFSISRDTFQIIMYAFLGLFKIFFIVFNLVPLLVLFIIG